jgi:hypothetical protein
VALTVGAITGIRELTSLRSLVLCSCPLTDTGVKDLRRIHGLVRPGSSPTQCCEPQLCVQNRREEFWSARVGRP